MFYSIPWIRGKVQQYAKQYWNLDFNLHILVSGRLTRALGKYHYYPARRGEPIRPISLQFAARLLSGDYKQETIESVIKHEVCHWALSQLGKPFDDKDWYFLQELKRIGSHPTHTIKNAGELYTAVCSKCGKTVLTKDKRNKLDRYLNTSRFFSKCCHATIIYGGYKVLEDNTIPVIPTAKPAPVYAGKVTIPAAQKVATVTLDAPRSTIPTNDIIQPGPRGVTNFQMIPAIRKAIDINSVENLEFLKITYPSVFESTLKYIGKSYFQKLQMMMR